MESWPGVGGGETYQGMEGEGQHGNCVKNFPVVIQAVL